MFIIVIRSSPLSVNPSNQRKMSKADEGRLIHIAKKRERAKEAIEQRRRKLEEETKNLKSGITTKFTANYDAIEDSLKTSTVGLVTLDEMREKQRDVVEARFCHQFLLWITPMFYTHNMNIFQNFDYTIITAANKVRTGVDILRAERAS
ncbi:unnamed protein product [Wuchereria bancrofti]|uniref:Uncharacterized protein n=1 Tax=Wuchereria bancrofti TaxID=6293 RepID=A0A3P7EU04_WUCBA|nr:unnamed protein product [Wuchereria bancrofti]